MEHEGISMVEQPNQQRGMSEEQKGKDLRIARRKNKTKQYGNGAGRYKQESYKRNEKLKRLFFVKEQTHLITTKS